MKDLFDDNTHTLTVIGHFITAINANYSVMCIMHMSKSSFAISSYIYGSILLSGYFRDSLVVGSNIMTLENSFMVDVNTSTVVWVN